MSLATAANLDFRHLVEASPEMSAVLAADETFTVLAVSDAYLEVTMKSREEVIGRGIFELFPLHPEDPSLTEEGEARGALEEAIATNEITVAGPFRYDIERPNGQGGGFAERYWEHRNVPICDDDGQVAHLIHRIEDVTDFIMQERSRDTRSAAGSSSSRLEGLRRSLTQRARRQFYDMFMKAPAFICMLEGPQHVFTMANPAYYELIGHREVIGHPVRDAFPEEELAEFIELLDGVYSTGTPQVFEEQEVVLRDSDTGRARRLYATFAYLPIYDALGQVEGVAIFGFEVTELVAARKEVEKQAARAERENKHKDEFLAMLGHELRNPLAPITTAVDVLREGSADLDAERVGWAANLIHRQLEHLVRLVDDLLDVARINQGRIELKEQRCFLDEIIANAVDSCRPLIDRKNHVLEVDLPRTSVELEVDAARLTQIIANLLNNAAKYTQPGGRIEIAAGVEGQCLVVEISDTGQGIEPELLPHIFNLFMQADTSLDRSQGGLGLGLTLVDRVVEMYGGRVEASSDGSGCGSRFRLELPVLADASQPDAHRHASEADSHADSRRVHRILVVDDNRDAADSLGMMLSSLGHDVEVAYDGETALALAGQFSPEVVLLDIGLPEMDGYQVARRLREDSQREHIVLVALTGYGQESDRELAFDAGFDHHLVKPAHRRAIERVLAANSTNEIMTDG